MDTNQCDLSILYEKFLQANSNIFYRSYMIEKKTSYRFLMS